jgi:membrane protein YqaA with SNARE-associated domain
MTALFHSLFGFFLTWWGAVLMAALDTSLLFFVPFANDALVVYLTARTPALFWLYPLLTTAGSVAGAASTFWIGEKVGEVGLDRLVSRRHLERIQNRVRERGAIAMALPAVLPPPFPLTPYILTCGALKVDAWTFFMTFAGMRLVRFGIEGVLARRHGRAVLDLLESTTFRWIIVGFIVIALVGTVVSAVVLWRRTRERRPSAA